jgi:hypothetical protein
MPHRQLLLAALIALCAMPAYAQETRAELLEKERAEKAKQLAPYEPGRIEKTLLYIERKKLFDLVSPRNGFFVTYGYSGKPVGSGVGLGVGWRHDLFDRNARVVFEAGQSWTGYRMLRADFSLPQLFDNRLELGIEGSHRRHPSEEFYGLGPDSLEEARTNFLFKGPGVQGRAVFTPVKWFNTGMRVGWIDVSIGSGNDDRYPSTEELFTPFTAPGLNDDPSFLATDLFATVDTRDHPGNAREGGYYGVLWRRLKDRDLDRYSFNSVDVDLQQFIPVFDKKRVFATRVRLTTTNELDGNEVPFYFRPTLGGSRSLRSEDEYRFRDLNVFWTNIEYRWEAFSGLDMALFTDFGGVDSDLSHLKPFDKKAYGIGLRFNTYKAVFLRFDVAAGGDSGIHYHFKFSGVF